MEKTLTYLAFFDGSPAHQAYLEDPGGSRGSPDALLSGGVTRRDRSGKPRARSPKILARPGRCSFVLWIANDFLMAKAKRAAAEAGLLCRAEASLKVWTCPMSMHRRKAAGTHTDFVHICLCCEADVLPGKKAKAPSIGELLIHSWHPEIMRWEHFALHNYTDAACAQHT